MKTTTTVIFLFALAATGCDRDERSATGKTTWLERVDNETPTYRGLTPETAGKVLPVLRLETARAPGRERIEGTLTIVTDHRGDHRDLATAPVAFSSRMAIRRRGQHATRAGQPSFTVELRDDSGGDRKAELLGMPAGEDWALVACWGDRTCMRNALAYSIGRELGRWNPRARHVEVIHDGDYLGLYLLVEAPKPGKRRLAVSAPHDEDLTGDYVIRRESVGQGDESDWVSPVGSPGRGLRLVFSHHYPRVSRLTGPQRRYIEDHMAAFERLMAGPDWNDRQRGLHHWIDLPSWADYAIVNELANNVDAYWRSMYIVKRSVRRGGRLHMTPLWDFNLGFGNTPSRDGWRLDLWAHAANRLFGECHGYDGPPDGCDACEPMTTCANAPFVPFWWERLWTDERFKAAVRERWRGLRSPEGPLDLARLRRKLDGWTRALSGGPIQRHYARWPRLREDAPERPGAEAPYWGRPCGRPQPLYPIEPCAPAKADDVRFLEAEVAWLSGWIERRLTWMDRHLPRDDSR